MTDFAGELNVPVVQQRRELGVQVPVLHDVIIQRADGAHQATAVQQRHR